MSLKPQFAAEILTGQKKCEVRTFIGPINKGDMILVYYSSPVKAVKGYFIAGDSTIVRPGELMNVIGNKCGDIPRDNLEYVMTKYLGSRRRILILEVTSPTILPNAVTIEELRKLNIKPPRSYMKISNRTCQEIIAKALNRKAQ
ncbi:hypothetical protein [Vulcanisaeta distributa]|uniref:ASCH domain-containing protein n=1 Tax=Vulcanisaeta distributa (strain DSM 14429 / JCM 11212 / NBRC 100878 / IC-017) TaxID=572478 RepID=E1QNM3_VULDI|nr:hypothetical protein [Vulcanisaeta distributa]ADN51311.1 conserved hypothetical protein [Vulcanisaeta distributa DSM 14429]